MRLLASLLVAGILVASSSASMAQTTAPASGGALPSPHAHLKAGACLSMMEGLCSTVAVDQWTDTPFTPPVTCSSPEESTCQLLMDINAPTSGGPWPIVIYLAGGPTEEANDRFALGTSPFAMSLAGQGAVVITPAWREAAWEGGGWPTSFQDVACAIGVARAIGPAYGGDPDRVTLGGHSTGGWPPAVLALTPTPFTPEPGSCDQTAGSLRPDAVVMSDGNLDEVSAQSDGRDYVVGFLGGDEAARPDEWAAADPFALVKRYPAGPDAIPSLLIYGEYDQYVSPKVSPAFHDALVAAGYDSRLLMIPGGDHTAALGKKATIAAILDIATGK
jgi:acetyl esterase/lipase